jgi:hypothetical protein
MAHLDRPGMIELLDRLGAQDDATVLGAARELHRKVGESGFTWDDALCAQSAAAFGGAADEAPADAPADDEPAAVDTPAPDHAEAIRLLDRLLTRKNISSTLREDLVELKRNMAEGSFDAMDARYVRALAKRLGA